MKIFGTCGVWFVLILLGAVGAYYADKGIVFDSLVSISRAVTRDVAPPFPDQNNALLAVQQGHPRLHVNTERLPRLKIKMKSEARRWHRLRQYAEAGKENMLAKALVGLVSVQPVLCRQAIQLALHTVDSSKSMDVRVAPVALVYDWCYSSLQVKEKQAFIRYFNRWGDHKLAHPGYADVPGYGNYWPRNGYDFAAIGLATYGDNPRAREWMNEFRIRRFEHVDLDLLNKISRGGGWPEGPVYDWIGNLARVKAMDAWLSATGENLFEKSPWFRERLGFLLMQKLPGTAKEWGYPFHPYVASGDAEHGRGTMVNYGRIMGLILVQQFANDPLAQQLMGYLSEGETADSANFLLHDEFLWFDSTLVRHPPKILTHYAEGTGTVFMRSGWPDGAADLDKSPTWASFQAGDHFSYHQHYDQNSFTLYKYADLLLDSGVYSGNGLSYHDVNYYLRSVAHNTLLVYNADENMSHARPGAVANDGGQRTFFPASRAPTTASYFDRHYRYYDTADILRFADSKNYTYVLGDATQAYNSSRYSQSENTWLSGNIAKVDLFKREFVYLRSVDHPGLTGEQDFVVIFDRVGVTRSVFSGEKTKLLFHMARKPEVIGEGEKISEGEILYHHTDEVSMVNGEGKLFMRVLWPREYHLRSVGGRNQKAYWVFGDNYNWHWKDHAGVSAVTTAFDKVPYGEWRLELEPADTALAHHFLTVLYPTHRSTRKMPDTDLIDADHMTGVQIHAEGLNRVVLFASDQAGVEPEGVLRYRYLSDGKTRNLLFDLLPGRHYQLTFQREGADQVINLTPDPKGRYVVSDQGVLEFIQ